MTTLCIIREFTNARAPTVYRDKTSRPAQNLNTVLWINILFNGISVTILVLSNSAWNTGFSTCITVYRVNSLTNNALITICAQSR